MRSIRIEISDADLEILAICNTVDDTWLNDYKAQAGIFYPFIYDAESRIFNDYQVGGTYGNYPPTYLIVDQNGVVQYRIDSIFDRIDEMKTTIMSLLGTSQS